VRVLEAAGYRVAASDIEGDARGCAAAEKLDFLTAAALPEGVLSIVTNPPFGTKRNQLAEAFMRKALELTEPVGGMVAMLARNEFDSARTRQDLFRPPYARKIVLTKRPRWSAEDIATPRHNFAWYCWDWRHVGPSQIVYAP
jgi:predicted RNA methylase